MSLRWRRDVKAASPGSLWGQAGSHRSLSEDSIRDRNRVRLQRPVGVCTLLVHPVLGLCKAGPLKLLGFPERNWLVLS